MESPGSRLGQNAQLPSSLFGFFFLKLCVIPQSSLFSGWLLDIPSVHPASAGVRCLQEVVLVAWGPIVSADRKRPRVPGSIMNVVLVHFNFFFFHSDVSFYFLKRSNKNQSSYSCGWGERTGCSQARGGGFLLSRRGREEVPAYGIAPPRPRPVTPSSSDFTQDTSSGPRVTLAEASLNLRASVAPGKPAGKFRCLGF